MTSLGAHPRFADAVEAAREAWPAVTVDEDAFTAYLIARWEEDERLLDNAASLYLACGCARGDDAAASAFREHYLPVLKAASRRLMPPGQHEDDFCQQLMTKLLVGEGDPAIAKYTGRGDLSTWLRVVATRDACRRLSKVKNQQHREVAAGDDWLADWAIDDEDPELGLVKQRAREQFKAAFHRAFEELSPRERNLMRHEYLHGNNLDQMARIYSVGRSTVARWRTKARERLFKGTRKILAEELAMSPTELDSMMGLIESQLEVSMTRLLAKPDP